MKVRLRPLQESDALTSWQWRNDPAVWTYTGSRPSTHITPAMELAWVKTVLARPDERRFAICVGEQQQYAGNVQLTHITASDAEFHIFIGSTQLQGQGVGTDATRLILDYAQHSLGLQQVYLHVHPDNKSAIRAYQKNGFQMATSGSGTDPVNARLTWVRKFTP